MGADSSSEPKAAQRTNRFATSILFVMVALAPLPFGSVDPSAIAVWVILLGVCALTVKPPRHLTRRQIMLFGIAAAIVAGYGIVLHEQLAARPWIAEPEPIWRDASSALGITLEATPSVARHQPFFSLGAPLAALLSVICSGMICTDRARAQQLVKVFAWSGAVYAIFGIVSYAIDPTKVLWREKQAYTTVLTATFINRNTAAVYFGAGSVIWLLISAEQIRRRLPDGKIRPKLIAKRLLTKMPRKIVISLTMLFLCLAAMFMTGSRAGVLLSLMTLVIAFVAFFRRDLPARNGIVIAIVVALAAGLLLLQIMGAGVSGRFDAQALADGGRLETYRSTLRMIEQHPWFGTGLGTFAWSYPAYRSPNVSLWGVWDRAHNTLLEIAADAGIPLACLVIIAWCAVFGVLGSALRAPRRDLLVPLAAFSVALIAVTHSLVDFSLQIPGFALVAFALIGAGLSQATIGRT